jgi:hypothetical protein
LFADRKIENLFASASCSETKNFQVSLKHSTVAVAAAALASSQLCISIQRKLPLNCSMNVNTGVELYRL